MPERRWLQHPAMVGIAIVFALGFAGLKNHAQEKPIEQATAQEQSAKQPAIVPQPADALTPTKPTGTEHDGDSASNREGSANNNLFWGDGIAQWVMAITGVFAILLSAWAVWLLKRTLEATQAAVRAADDAVEVTRQLGQAQVRAYVSWAGAKIAVRVDESGKVVGLVFTGTISNTGQSPAQVTGLYVSLEILPPEDNSPTVEFDISSAACSHQIGAQAPFEFVSRHMNSETAGRVWQGSVNSYLLGWASYRTIFSSEEAPDETTSFCFQIRLLIPPEMISPERINANIDLLSVPNYRIAPKS